MNYFERIVSRKCLADNLAIRTVEQAFEIVRSYYPNKTAKPETVFMLEEILQR